MYIQEKDEERDLKAPPDYSGHTYQPPPPVQETPVVQQVTKEQPTPTKAPEESVPTGVLTGDKKQDFSQKGGKRGGIFEEKRHFLPTNASFLTFLRAFWG